MPTDYPADFLGASCFPTNNSIDRWMAVAHRPHLRPRVGQATAEAESDPLQESLDALSDDVALLNEKVDAMMVTMMQLKR